MESFATISNKDVKNIFAKLSILIVRGVLVTPLQKQPSEVFYEKRCSSKFHKVHRKAPVPGLLFNKVADLRPATVL